MVPDQSAMPSAKDFKQEIFQQLARVGKCLSSDKRIEIMSLLSQGAKSVEKLAQATEMSVANISRHLQVLNDARLVKFRKHGNYVIYSLADPSIAEFLFALWRVSESQLADVGRIRRTYAESYGDIQTLSITEVKIGMEAGTMILIDVRPQDEYETGHVAGAISVPEQELDAFLHTILSPMAVVVYCRGPYCMSSIQTVARFREEGIMAYKLEEGVHEWLKEVN